MGVVMTMNINYIRADRVEWTDLWKGDFDTAREIAVDAVNNENSDRAEIRSECGSLVFHYPRVTRVAG